VTPTGCLGEKCSVILVWLQTLTSVALVLARLHLSISRFTPRSPLTEKTSLTVAQNCFDPQHLTVCSNFELWLLRIGSIMLDMFIMFHSAKRRFETSGFVIGLWGKTVGVADFRDDFFDARGAARPSHQKIIPRLCNTKQSLWVVRPLLGKRE